MVYITYIYGIVYKMYRQEMTTIRQMNEIKHRHTYDSVIDEKEQTIILRCMICGIPQKGKEVWPL